MTPPDKTPREFPARETATPDLAHDLLRHSIAPDVVVGEGTTLGEYTVIERGVRIGDGCSIGHHVVIHSGTVIEAGVRIDAGAVIGKQPLRAPNSAMTTADGLAPARIGAGSMIGAGAILYAGCTIGKNVLIADLATIREHVSVGDFTIVGRGVAIENLCEIGRYCKLETNAYLAARSVVEDRAFIAPGVITSNDNFMGRTAERFEHFKGATIRRGGRVGAGAVLLPGIEINPDAVVAAGAVQTRDAEAGTIYVGVPARVFGPVPENQKLDQQGWDD
jgi:acetyltransferase-like isoleucine patch superfamily enzyme